MCNQAEPCGTVKYARARPGLSRSKQLHLNTALSVPIPCQHWNIIATAVDSVGNRSIAALSLLSEVCCTGGFPQHSGS